MERGKTRHTFISCVVFKLLPLFFSLHDASLYFTTKCHRKHWFSLLPSVCQKAAVCAMLQHWGSGPSEPLSSLWVLGRLSCCCHLSHAHSKKTTISCCLNFPGDGINQNIWRMQGGGCPPPRGCPLGRGNPYVWASCVPKSCCLSVVPRMWWLGEKEETSIPLEWLLGMRLWRRDYMCHLITKTVAL